MLRYIKNKYQEVKLYIIYKYSKQYEVHVLSDTSYDKVQKMFNKPYVAKDDTDLTVAYNLGVQAVLKALRENIVVGK